MGAATLALGARRRPPTLTFLKGHGSEGTDGTGLGLNDALVSIGIPGRCQLQEGAGLGFKQDGQFTGGIYRKWAAPDLAHSRNRGLGVAKRGGGTGVPAWIFANAPWP